MKLSDYTLLLLDLFDGGCIHFCGRGEHFIASMCETENMYGFNMSQPHLNDMDKIFKAASSADKRILSLPACDEYVSAERVIRGLVHGR